MGCFSLVPCSAAYVKPYNNRAFACYVKDKVPFRLDYLVGHADTVATEDSKAYPVGEERRKINVIFDELFDDLRVRGILEKK